MTSVHRDHKCDSSLCSVAKGHCHPKRWNFCSLRKKKQRRLLLSQSCLGRDKAPHIQVKVSQDQTGPCGLTGMLPEDNGAEPIWGPQDSILGKEKKKSSRNSSVDQQRWLYQCRSNPRGIPSSHSRMRRKENQMTKERWKGRALNYFEATLMISDH